MNKKLKLSILIVALIIAAIAIIQFGPQESNQDSKSGEAVTFTAILPITGNLSHLGENERIGMSLALEDAKERGEKFISFKYEDSASRGADAVTVAQKGININGDRFFVVATTGPTLATLPVFDDLKDDKLVIAQTMYPKVTEGHPYAFRLFASSQQEAEMLAAHTISEGNKKVAALHIQNEWGAASVNIFKEALENAGGTMTDIEVFAFPDKDFRTTLLKIMESKPDALLIYAYPNHFPVIMKQYAELGGIFPILANADFAIGTIVDDIPNHILEKTVFPAPSFLYESENPRITEFNAHVRESGHEPNFDIATFYDMAMILNEAVKGASSTAPKDVKDSLFKVFPYDGVTGRMEITEARELRVDYALSKWVNKELVKISD